MQNKIIGILLIFCCTVVNAQNKDTIVWSKGYKLTWEDFKGRPKSSSTAGAITNSGISANYTYENGKITFRIIAKFNRKKSWVKPNDKILSTLEHEQLHFDITELYVRKLKKKLSETKFKSNPEKIKKQFYRIYDEINKELNYYQDLYDKETTNPRDEAKQEEWKEKVARELEELENMQIRN
ncbi:MAG: hypothetical protein KatS3mg028_1487 [Bacteroidia bacterium]|nr:MAG: hypothetical protein KatS3mg028_1487 [Bacteroidia bacterium]